MFESTGTLVYEGDSRLVVSIDANLSNYYRSLVPTAMRIQKPRWPAHITVVRFEKEIPCNPEYWGKYQGESVKFKYNPYLNLDKTYYWINVWCERLTEIRKELGLPPKSRWTRPPGGVPQECFHITIGNRKQ